MCLLIAHDFAVSYHTYIAPLHRYFYGHVGNAMEAEELTASTLDKALRDIEMMDDIVHDRRKVSLCVREPDFIDERHDATSLRVEII